MNLHIYSTQKLMVTVTPISNHVLKITIFLALVIHTSYHIQKITNGNSTVLRWELGSETTIDSLPDPTETS